MGSLILVFFCSLPVCFTLAGCFLKSVQQKGIGKIMWGFSPSQRLHFILAAAHSMLCGEEI